MAKTLPSGSACNGVYSGTFDGNVSISGGQNCVLWNGGVTGNINSFDGNLTLIQSQVGGDVVFTSLNPPKSTVKTSLTIGPGTTIKGSVLVLNLDGSPALLSLPAVQ